jgi:hypothetical protein
MPEMPKRIKNYMTSVGERSDVALSPNFDSEIDELRQHSGSTTIGR